MPVGAQVTSGGLAEGADLALEGRKRSCCERTKSRVKEATRLAVVKTVGLNDAGEERT